MKHLLQLGLGFLCFASLANASSNCTLLVKERPSSEVINAFSEKGYKLTLKKSLAQKGMSLETTEIGGEEVEDNNPISLCDMKYRSSKVITTITISDLSQENLIAPSDIYTGNSSYHKPCDYPQTEFSTEVVAKRLANAEDKALTEALNQLRKCK